MPQLTCHSPIGDLTLTEEDGAIVALDWGRGCQQEATPLLQRACRQLEEYFDGGRREFDVAVAPQGTDFQRRVWQALAAIPYGTVERYGVLARALGSAPRAIGGACGRNPLPILIPCHRVVGHAGGLGGYSGLEGVETKRFLLHLEGVTL